MGSWDCHTELRPSAKLGLPMLPGVRPSAHARLLEYRCWGAETTQLSQLQDSHTYPQVTAFGRYIVTTRTRPEGSQKSTALGSFPGEEMAHHSGPSSFEGHASGGGCSSQTDGTGRSLRGQCIVFKDPACLPNPPQAPVNPPCSFQRALKRL